MAVSIDAIKTSLDNALKLWYTIDAQLKELDSDMKRLEREFSEIRIDHVKLEARVASLEGLRESMRKDVEIEIGNAISQMKIEWLTKQLQAAQSPHIAPSLPQQLDAAEK